MKKAIPSIYKKNIFDIDYNSLKKNDIKCLIFDLDNTLTKIDNNNPSKETIELISKLKKDFVIYVLTNNNNKERLDAVCNKLDIPYVSFALKPSKIGFKKILKLAKVKENETCVIGDQIVTDIIGGNRLKAMTILVEPLGTKDLKITSFNRFVEKKIIKRLEKKNQFKKGEFYDKR